MTLTMDPRVPISGADGGTRPPSARSKTRLLVEGWRLIPHSYSIVNQQQCLELLRRPDIELMFRDTPILPRLGGEVRGVLSAEDERAVAGIPPYDGGGLDAVLRMGYPFDFGPSCCDRTFVFATCERMVLKTVDVLAPPTDEGRSVRPFQQRIDDNNITIITPSEHSRRGMIRSGIDPGRVVVVPHGVDPAVFCPLDPAEKERQKERRGTGGNFVFLHVSAMTGNKNPGAVINAFLAVVKKHPEARLVLKGMSLMFGSNSWLSLELGRLSPSDRLLAKETIFYNGLVLTDADQRSLYQLADAYVSPYQSEAFNIPVLEAAACGLPVIVSDGGPTNEFTTGDFALPVEARFGDHHHDGSMWLDVRPEALERQMERALLDGAFRARALEAGPAFVRAYSWKNVVDQILGVMGIPVVS